MACVRERAGGQIVTTGSEGPNAVGVADPAALLHELRETRLWAGVPDETLLEVARRMHARRFEDGEFLITQGNPGEALHLVTSGSVEIRVRPESGAEILLSTLGRGESLGEMSLLTGDAASASVVAKGTVESLALSAQDFAEVVAANGALLHRFVRILVDRLTRSDEAVSQARTRQQDLTEFLRETDAWDDDLVGTSAPVRKLRKTVASLARGKEPVLIQGEEGSGRRVAANLLHRSSARADSLVISVDCTQISENASGAGLFGTASTAGTAGTEGSRTLCYLDLAEGGTLVLKHLESMPTGAQRRLAEHLAKGRGRRDVRVVALCAASGTTKADRVLAELRACFENRTIEVAPLRDRKRDIPLLAERYLEKHATRLNKKACIIDDQAMTRLVSYDYHIGNDRELEQAVERAVILTDGAVVEAETIFLGPPPPPRRGVFNLLALTRLDVRRLVGALPRRVRVASALFFAFILYLAFFGSTPAQGNLATYLVWGVWWPLLVLSFFLGGRVWCAACPIGLVTTATGRFTQGTRRIPAWLKKHDVKLALGGLFLILFVEEATAMRHSPLATGLLLIAIVAGAAVTGWLYPRRTWCRHLCPLGGLAGACATAGVLELRPTFDVCSAKCTGHACYKGNGDVDGCPMFNHVMFVDSNQHCVMCMQCVQSCPNASPQLNLRLPGREIWDGTAASPKLGWFVLGLMGMLLGITVIQHVEHGSYATVLAAHRLLLVAAILGACTALPLLLARSPARAAARRGEPAQARFWNRVAAFAPVMSAGLVAYQLAYVPGLEGVRLSLTAGGPGVTVTLLAILRVGIVLAGLLATLVILWRVNRRGRDQGAPPTRRVRRASFGAAVAYGALLLLLMLTP
jgi:transcriptional regulator with AAA-type ATPase domain